MDEFKTENIDEQTENPKKKHSLIKNIVSWALILLTAFVVSGLLKSFVIMPIEVQQQSMVPTFSEGDKLLLYRTGYFFESPKRGDVVVFTYSKGKYGKWIEMLPIENSGELNYIKRVIGIAGDTIEFSEGHVVRNGEALDEPYANGETYGKEDDDVFVVPEGSIFVMGDNREKSIDSREFGFVKLSSVKGKAVLRIWPFDAISTVKSYPEVR